MRKEIAKYADEFIMGTLCLQVNERIEVLKEYIEKLSEELQYAQLSEKKWKKFFSHEITWMVLEELDKEQVRKVKEIDFHPWDAGFIVDLNVPYYTAARQYILPRTTQE